MCVSGSAQERRLRGNWELDGIGGGVLAGERASERLAPSPKYTADVILAPKPANPDAGPPDKRLIAIGASTGGTEALLVVLADLPKDLPPILIVQHLPKPYIGAFVERLDARCAVDVVVAGGGAPLKDGCVYIAPGDRHLLVRRSGAAYGGHVIAGKPVARHRPSADVLFRSVAQAAGRQALGVVMTGMGDDGARGLREMREAGAATFVQDEATCAVFGMPRSALARGAADTAVPLERISLEIVEWARSDRPVGA